MLTVKALGKLIKDAGYEGNEVDDLFYLYFGARGVFCDEIVDELVNEITYYMYNEDGTMYD